MTDDISSSLLPLGSQQSQTNNDNDEEEQRHFQHVIQSYQQYATFHQTRQRGVNRRLEKLIRNETPMVTDKPHHHPTLQSILPPSLIIQPPLAAAAALSATGITSSNTTSSATEEYLTYQKEFSSATIRNQFFLDNILQYSNQETSQDVLRWWRQQKQQQQQHEYRSCCHVDDNGTNENFRCNIEWTTEDRISKIDSVLKSVARDWSREGHEERSVVYDRMIMALLRHLPLSNSTTRDDEDGECDQQQTDIDDSPATTKSSRTTTTPTPLRVAVPGSGLGRLAWEIYSRGYSVEGSDFSLPMLLASDFILNGCGGGGGGDGGEERGCNSFQQFRISPWLAETKNVLSLRDRIRTVTVPDVDPTAVDHSNIGDGCESPEFTMLAGEFLNLYSRHVPGNERTCSGGKSSYPQSHCHHHHHNPVPVKKFNAVVCSFFIDTAPSLPHYLLTIYHMLEDGGLFIHCGPLMYHWSGHGGLLPGDDCIGSSNANGCKDTINENTYHKRNKHLDSRYLTSIDYTWEEVRYMIVHCGFDVLEEEFQIPAHYTIDRRSMMKVGYDCVFCVARKKIFANR